MISSFILPQQQVEKPVHTFLSQLVNVSKHELNIPLPGLDGSYEDCQYGSKNSGKDEILLDKTVRNC